MVIQMWLMIPAPSTSNRVRLSPSGMFSKRSLFPPVRSKLLTRRLRAPSWSWASSRSVPSTACASSHRRPQNQRREHGEIPSA